MSYLGAVTLRINFLSIELYFVYAIILNSPYKLDVVTQNMQYFDENKRNGSAPAYLDETDYEKIIDSEKSLQEKST